MGLGRSPAGWKVLEQTGEEEDLPWRGIKRRAVPCPGQDSQNKGQGFEQWLRVSPGNDLF